MIFYKTYNKKFSLEELEELEKEEEEQLIEAIKENLLEAMRWIFLFLIIYCRYLILD